MKQVFNNIYEYLASLNKWEDVERKLTYRLVIIYLLIGGKFHNRNMQMRS